jgi:hypothetical protein
MLSGHRRCNLRVIIFRERRLVMKRLVKSHREPGAGDLLRSAEDRAVDPRIAGPFPAKVRGVDVRGEGFELEVVLDDLSANDFNLRLSRHVAPGSKLFVLVRIYEATLALRGLVQRIEPRTDGISDFTVAINGYRFV